MVDHIEQRAKALVIKWGGLGWAGFTPEQVVPSARFYEDLHADSLDNIELIISFEDEFGIEISDEAAARVNTFGDAVQLVRELCGTATADAPEGNR